MFKVIVSLIMSICLLSFAYAGTTGKISGLVTDKNNGEPLVGVNVIVDDTFLGASTDIDGYYSILNVPAGNYSIVVNYVGYSTTTYKNIRVVPDITKRIDVQLQETTIELGEEIVIIAERPFFEQSATNTVRVLDAEQIRRVPVKGVNKVISINAGVVASDGHGGDLDNATLNIRGGRGNETLVIIDGIPQNDGMFGNAAGSVPDGAIEQISSQIGGFSAKYGNAQSGIINAITKSGSAKYFGSFEGVSSNLTDPYNYNSVSGTFGGPIIPGSRTFDFFLSGEFIKTDDVRPRASGLTIPSANIDTDVLPNMDGDLLRMAGKINARITDNLKLTASGNASFRDSRQFITRYAKNSSTHFPKIEEDVMGASLKLSQVFDESSFMDFIARYRDQNYQRADGFWYDDVLSYGDSSINAAQGITLPNGDGDRILTDDNGVFWDEGRVWNFQQKYRVQTVGLDLNFTKQFKNHFVELGGSFEQSIVRYYLINPIQLATKKDTRSMAERYFAGMNTYYGYDLYGSQYNDDDKFITVSGDRFQQAGPKKPITAGFYFQDKIEFNDFILNLGFRWDYFDPNFDRIKDVAKVLGDDGLLSEDDFEKAPSESYISPRIGFAYPISEFSVFHAQYGIFRQRPRYFDIYDSWSNLDDLESMDGQGQNLGNLKMEQTTQYEFGFKQQLGNVAALDITAFYKNIKGLVNDAYLNYAYGQSEKAVIARVNADFGTIKGIAFSFNLRKIGPLSAKIDYTLEQAEGTGSSQNSSFVSAFRSNGNKTPIAIAPLDFEQTHTLTMNFDIRSGDDEGPKLFGIKPLQNTGANILLTYTSGRPYTPLESVNILAGYTRYGSLTQYVNSAVHDGIFKIDLKIDKRFQFGKVGFIPYLWIQNLLNRENFVDVWDSTGQPDNTAYLETPEGQQVVQSVGDNGPGYASDYKALEKDPLNYGSPRMIRIGVQVDF
jgi:outer membrane receptor protein involved in Fe transport